jgi:hypothetical protein
MEQGSVIALVRLRAPVPLSLRVDALRRDALSHAIKHADSAKSEAETGGQVEVPGGLNAIHPSWLRYVLAREDLGVAAALCTLLESSGVTVGTGPWANTRPAVLSPAVLRDLLWLLFGRLSDPAPPHSQFLVDRHHDGTSPGARTVLWHRLGGTVLWRALCERGAAEVGRSLHGADKVMRARAMATVGAPWAQIVEKHASGPVDVPSRDRARLSLARASALAARDDLVEHDIDKPAPEVRLSFVGLCAARSELSAAGAVALRTIALRLPAVVGRCLMESGTT